jgi:hypothetical protein
LRRARRGPAGCGAEWGYAGGGTDRGEDDADGEEGRGDLVEAAVEERGDALGRDARGVGDEEVRLVEQAGEDRLEELGDGPADGGEHGEAAVLDLCAAEGG